MPDSPAPRGVRGRRGPGSPARVAGLVGGVVVVVVVALVLTGVVGTSWRSGGDAGSGGPDAPGSPAPTSEASATGTTLADVDTTTVDVARGPFCAEVDPAAVGLALGLSASEGTDRAGDGGEDADGALITARTWANGQRARLEEGLRDVAHEDGCAWSGPGGTRARAWVFTPPLTRREARDLAGSATDAAGCRAAPDAPSFGAPSVALDCVGDDGRERHHRGLFGQAWLSCSVEQRGGALPGPATRADPAAELAARASTFCAAVVAAAAT